MQFRFGPRDIVGSFDMAAEVPRWFDAVVEQDVVALSHDYEISSDLWEDHPELGFDFMQLLALMLLSLREQLADRRTTDAELAAT
jgi:CRP-like cAMP-binding protein